MSFPKRTAAAVTAVGLAGAAVWAFSGGGSGPDSESSTIALGRIENIALTTKHDCTELLSYYRTEATRIVGPYGLNDGPQMYATADDANLSARKSLAPQAESAASGAAVPDSTTNVQVEGVDESDVVKTNGDLMVSVVNGGLRVTRLAGADTKTLATWIPTDGQAQAVLLDGNTAVVFSDQNGAMPELDMKMIAPKGFGSSPMGGTNLTVLDLSDPAHPRPVRQLELGGSRSGEARLVDGEIRLALTGQASGIKWQQPEFPNMKDPRKAEAKFKKIQERATEANKRLIAKSTIDNWIPQATVTSLDAKGKPEGSAVTRPLVDCDQVAIPGSFSGLSTLALVSLDLHADTPLSTWRSAGVIAAGSTVYATADHIWLATSRWEGVRLDDATSTALRFAPSSANAQIHRFDTPLRGQPRYIASGEIAGSLLNQFSMDEKDGLLRVASTTEGQNQRVFPIDEPAETVKPAKPAESDESAVSNSATTENGVTADTPVSSTGATGGGSTGSTGPAAEPGSDGAVTDAAKPAPGLSLPPTRPAVAPKEKPSEGRVTVLKVDGDELAEVGVIKGLGVGERIRGVRFIGDVGYVVTYRQTDPLYMVDLSDPAHPKVRGELSVLGYSAYLHPAGDGRLLGLGQDGTKEGASTGLQLSLFDVSNLDAPRRLDRTRMAGAWSDVEGDHHAFTMAGDLVLIPYSAWTSVEDKGSSDVAPDDTYVSRFDAGVIAVRVGPDGLGQAATLRPIADGQIDFPQTGNVPKKVSRITDAYPLRTLVHDGTIYTLTATGVAAHSGTTFDRLTFAEF